MTNLADSEGSKLYDSIVSYLQDSTTSDPLFFKLSALFVCSVAIQDNVRLKTEYATVKPNLYIMLLGKSTISHKTTLMNLIIELLSDKHIDYMVSSWSPEGLTKFLADNRKALFIKDEFGGMLASMASKDYMSDAKDLLMELYDNKKTLNRQLSTKTITLKDPYFAIFTALTPERFIESFSYQDIHNGFLVRFAVANYHESTEKHKVNLTAHTLHKLNIIAEIANIRKVLGNKQRTIILSDEAEQLFDKYTKPIINDKQDELTLALYGRYNVMVLKVAMTMFVLDNYKSMDKLSELPVEYVERAIEFLKPVLSGMLYLLKTITMHPQVNRILGIIKQKEIADHSYVLWKSHMKAQELKPLIDTLRQMDMVKVMEDKGKIYYILKKDVDEM